MSSSKFDIVVYGATGLPANSSPNISPRNTKTTPPEMGDGRAQQGQAGFRGDISAPSDTPRSGRCPIRPAESDGWGEVCDLTVGPYQFTATAACGSAN
jgi:hypothetical protein